jgi:hypothetical protein
VPLLGVHNVPCVNFTKFPGPEMEALKIGSRFSPVPQPLNGGMVIIPLSGPPVSIP